MINSNFIKACIIAGFRIVYHNRDTTTFDYKTISNDSLQMNIAVLGDTILLRRRSHSDAITYPVVNNSFYANQRALEVFCKLKQ